MSTEYEINFGKSRIQFRLRRSNRRSLAITVKPDQSVVVTAPRAAKIEKVLDKVANRAKWIVKQQRFFGGFLPKRPPRSFVSGETHRYLGRQYRLKVVEAGTQSVKLKGPFIYVETPQRNDTVKVSKQVRAWYNARAKERFDRSFADSAKRLGRRLSKLPNVKLRRMPNRWGSWTKREIIWLNPVLVEAPPSCIDYVLTHELCHTIHPHHGKDFFVLLRQVMPDWEVRKARLERVMT